MFVALKESRERQVVDAGFAFIKKHAPLGLKIFVMASMAALILFSPALSAVFLSYDLTIPFGSVMTYLLVAAAVGLRNVVRAFANSCVPLGVAVSVYRLFVTLLGAETAVDLSASLPLLYSPLALGLFLSYALRIVEPVNLEQLPITPVWHTTLILTGATGVFTALFVMDGYPFTTLIRLDQVVVVALIFLACLAYNDKEKLPLNNVIARAGTMTCILTATFGVAIYAYYVDIGADDPSLVGPVLADLFALMLYGSVTIMAVSVSDCCLGTDKEVRTRDWHLSEAYVFLTLIIFPPAGVLTLF